MTRHLTELPGTRLFELEARDLRRGPFPGIEKVRVRADTRADAIARLTASDFEPLLDWEDRGLPYEQSPQSPVDMSAAIAREIPAA
jgi:hypothetical protein